MTEFIRCVLDIWVGQLTPRPMRGEFDSVLTISGDSAGVTEDGVRHRHLATDSLDKETFRSAVMWVYGRAVANQRILVRGKVENPWPTLVVAGVVIQCGGHLADAITSVREARTDTLPDATYTDILKGFS